jgi:hypothetical protein
MTAFLDTSVFLYAAGRDHPEREACASLLRRVAAGSVQAVTSSEVLQELLHVLTRRGLRPEGLRLARDVAVLCAEVLPVTAEDMLECCDLLDRYPALGVRDAVHAACMLRNGITRIVSADAALDGVRSIRRLSPSAA